MSEHKMKLNTVPQLYRKISDLRVKYWNDSNPVYLKRILSLRWRVEQIWKKLGN